MQGPPPVTPAAEFEVVVVGGGPAACATAIGLSALGFRVVIVNRPRRRRSIEGLSARTLQALKSLGAQRAIASTGPAVHRASNWNGSLEAAGMECLVERDNFDRALIDDAADAGVWIESGRVINTQQIEQGWRVSWYKHDSPQQLQTLDCDFLVEARGRAAPKHFETPSRGPRALALGQQWTLKTPRDASRIIALPSGWTWWASAGHKAQFHYISETLEKSTLNQQYQQSIDNSQEIKTWLQGAEATGKLNVCDASISYFRESVGLRCIRVGDAALAPDPLSGQGVFEAIASALAATPTINTLLRKPEKSEAAKKFYQQRYQQRYLSIARTGRDFYQVEPRFHQNSFWQTRQQWPDKLPSHPEPNAATTTIEKRPVVIDQFIDYRRVLVCDDYPRGVWKLNGIPLLPFIQYINAGGQQLEAHFPASQKLIDNTKHWLQARGLL